MDLNLTNVEVLLVLDAILDSHGRCLSCDDEEAVRDRKTLQELYNKILSEAHDNKIGSMLRPIGTIAN